MFYDYHVTFRCVLEAMRLHPVGIVPEKVIKAHKICVRQGGREGDIERKICHIALLLSVTRVTISQLATIS